MNFRELAAARYSVRKFKTDPVEKEKLDLIIEALRNAPTAANRQPQRVLVVASEEGLRKMDQVTPCRFGAPLVLLICYDSEACWVRPTDKQDSGFVDASIVTAQAMLQAADLGLGSTWVMFFDAAKARQEFGIPENLIPVAVLPLGYPAPDAAPSDFHAQRLPADKLVFFERM
ncbi:MAG: nitroreductase family protein [Spirochaetaceae bacterium]|jgi:nitroreductase|nr:nitroreductase family protein [Spirochaetaceae bacterium]